MKYRKLIEALDTPLTIFVLSIIVGMCAYFITTYKRPPSLECYNNVLVVVNPDVKPVILVDHFGNPVWCSGI